MSPEVQNRDITGTTIKSDGSWGLIHPEKTFDHADFTIYMTAQIPLYTNADIRFSNLHFSAHTCSCWEGNVFSCVCLSAGWGPLVIGPVKTR